MTWRVGRKLGRTLYRDDACVGMVDTPELAAQIAAAMNEASGVDPLAAFRKELADDGVRLMSLSVDEADDEKMGAAFDAILSKLGLPKVADKDGWRKAFEARGFPFPKET